MSFWNNQPSLITQGSEKRSLLEKKEYIASFITTSTGVSRLPGFQTIPSKWPVSAQGNKAFFAPVQVDRLSGVSVTSSGYSLEEYEWEKGGTERLA